MHSARHYLSAKGFKGLITLTSILIYFMSIAIPFFSVRVLAVVWNILPFAKNSKTQIVLLLCLQGALDKPIDSSCHLTVFSESYSVKTKERLVC